MRPWPSDTEARRAIDGVRRHALEGVLPDAARWLGFRRGECADLLVRLGLDEPGDDEPVCGRSESPFLRSACSMLWTHRASEDPRTRLMAGTVACACFGSRHLWQDLGLDGREQVSAPCSRATSRCWRTATRGRCGGSIICSCAWEKNWVCPNWGHHTARIAQTCAYAFRRPIGCKASRSGVFTVATRKRKKESIALEGAVWMTVGGENLGGQGRVGLLRAIAEHGSITQAAKAIGMSYKGAWDAVDVMNNLAGAPLVERAAGGRGGGSTRLTPRGLQLVERFAKIDETHGRFVQLLSDEAIDLATDFNLMRLLNMKISARNQLLGTVSSHKIGAVNDEVELTLAGGARIVAIVTRESAELLGLKVGATAFALVKAPSVIIATDLDGARLSARNQLKGTISAVTPGAVNAEVVLDVGGGVSIAAIVTQSSLHALGLAPGDSATALFKASSVIVGVMA